MNRLLILAGALAALGLTLTAILVRRNAEPRPWKTTDVWYHESDVAQLGRTGRPQLVEFFHPD